MRSSKRFFGLFSAASFFTFSPYLFYRSPSYSSEPAPLDRKQEFEAFLSNFQIEFVAMIQSFETKSKFFFDKWDRPDKNGYGLTCVLQDGGFFEKAGINTTKLTMPLNKTLAQHMRQRGKSYENEENLLVYANGVSLVIHPISPFIPTVHANYRYFEIQDKTTGKTLDFWFGGGADLTPHYLFEEDCVLFHQEHKKACDSTKDLTLYPKLKKICDEYFYLPHRKEHRGIGGVFYDDFLIENDWYKTFRFSSFCATAVLNAYKEILNRRKDLKWTEENMHWKEIRRGRYAEFNLIIDRGTKFGLFTPDARIESILMSLPLVARWEYMHQVEKGSEEEKMMEVIKNARNWI